MTAETTATPTDWHARAKLAEKELAQLKERLAAPKPRNVTEMARLPKKQLVRLVGRERSTKHEILERLGNALAELREAGRVEKADELELGLEALV